MECDPSIKSIIVKIDSEDHAFIVEELDDQTLVVKENMLSILKMRLDEASLESYVVRCVAKLTQNLDPRRDTATSGRLRRGMIIDFRVELIQALWA